MFIYNMYTGHAKIARSAFHVYKCMSEKAHVTGAYGDNNVTEISGVYSHDFY